MWETDSGAPAVVRVLLAIEQEVMIRGFRDIISAEPDIEIVAEARSAQEVPAAITVHQPQVVIAASDLPPIGALRLTRKITKTERLGVIVVAVGYNDAELAQVIRAGARGYLPSTFRAEELVAAIHALGNDEAFLTPSAIRRLFDRFLILPACTEETDVIPAELRDLSSREIEVVRAIGHGSSNREIARELSVSEATVKTHISNALNKLGVRDRVHLALIAWGLGLVAIPEVLQKSAGRLRVRSVPA